MNGDTGQIARYQIMGDELPLQIGEFYDIDLNTGEPIYRPVTGQFHDSVEACEALNRIEDAYNQAMNGNHNAWRQMVEDERNRFRNWCSSGTR